jgi:DNA (cytosine-5)-methyltransferase 1
VNVLELFCGIGGCATALSPRDHVLAAVDQNLLAIATYAANFEHKTLACAVADLPASLWLVTLDGLWWLSPPCQPFTSRGNRRDLDDPRCDGFKFVVQKLKELRPRRIAVENVPGFLNSRAHALLTETLRDGGYDSHESIECPIQLGIPMRRRRYFLAADRDKLIEPRPIPQRTCKWSDVIEPSLNETQCSDLVVPPEDVERFGESIHIVDPSNEGPLTIAKCFTSGYAKSPRYSGSCLRMPDGQVRKFSPREILRLLGFPESFVLPPSLSLSQQWSLIGNSLSIDCARTLLARFSQFP